MISGLPFVVCCVRATAARCRAVRTVDEFLASDPAVNQMLELTAIQMELMTGLRTTERKESMLQWFAPIVRLPFEVSWWKQAWNLAARLRREGITPTAADCLIATVAINHQAVLIHCDAAFESMKPVVPLLTLDWTLHLSRR